MNSYKRLTTKAVWLGSIGLVAMLLAWTPSCKAQEVSPAIFTDTGVEDIYPATKPLPGKIAKAQPVSNVMSTSSNKVVARKLKAHQAARKEDVAFVPSI